MSATLLASIRNFIPRPKVRAWEWVCANGRTPSGEQFAGDLMPWAQGVCDAWDSRQFRKVILMWGTRLGKTMIGMQLMACAMETNPMPGIFGTAGEKLATRTMRNKIYPMLERVKGTRQQLLPPHLRNIRELRLRDSTWAVVWSGSPMMLADWSARYGYGNEIDKWDVKKSSDGEASEGDTLSQFEERLKEWPDRKLLLECSPSLKGKSRVEREYLASNRCKYHVPCPHCGEFQALRLGGEGPGGGLKFDRDENGKTDAEIARKTARYECDHCSGIIEDQHRWAMMKLGKWCPAGCRVSKSGEIVGTPDRDGEIWGGQLSSLYSLQLRWGDIAAAFVSAIGHSRKLQMFVNGWLAETWEPYRSKTEPEEVGERLTTETPRGVIPLAATWRFDAVDVQESHFVWVITACGPGERVYLIDWGMADTWEEVEAATINREIPHEDGKGALKACLTLIDSGDGNRTKEVYAKCRQHSRPDRLVIPCKGANNNCNGEAYQMVTIGDGTKSGTRLMKRRALQTRGVILARVNPFFWEPVIQQWLDEKNPGEEESLSLPFGANDDDELLEQICNGAQSHEPSKLDPDKLLWVKRWDDKANDFRDCLKYARCGMEMKFRSNWKLSETRQGSVAVAAPVVAATPDPEPTGRRGLRNYRDRSERMRRR